MLREGRGREEEDEGIRGKKTRKEKTMLGNGRRRGVGEERRGDAGRRKKKVE